MLHEIPPTSSTCTDASQLRLQVAAHLQDGAGRRFSSQYGSTAVHTNRISLCYSHVIQVKPALSA